MDKDLNPVRSRTRELVFVAGSFLPNGSSALASSSPTTGNGFTVARSSVGKFIVTLADAYPSNVAPRAELRMAGSHPYKVQVGAVDVSSAKTIELYVVSLEQVGVVKTAADGAAGTTTSETIMGRCAAGLPIGHTLYLSPQAALTADNTNNATITISKRTAGASKTTVATLTTNVASGNWVAFTPIAIPLTVAVAAGDTLQYEIAKAASGVVVPAFVLESSGLQDIAASASNAIHVQLALKNSGVTP